VISLAILKHELQLDANPVSDLSKRNNNNNNQARIKKYMRFMAEMDSLIGRASNRQ